MSKCEIISSLHWIDSIQKKGDIQRCLVAQSRSYSNSFPSILFFWADQAWTQASGMLANKRPGYRQTFLNSNTSKRVLFEEYKFVSFHFDANYTANSCKIESLEIIIDTSRAWWRWKGEFLNIKCFISNKLGIIKDETRSRYHDYDDDD